MEPVVSKLLAFDRPFRQEGRVVLAGVDEAGRGPLAGPVVAAAVIFLRDTPLEGLNDSKQVGEKRREKLFREICRSGAVGLGIVDERQIDTVNIYQASRLAMKLAVLDLPRTPDFLLIDGKASLDLPLSQKTVVEGDARSASIAAASIIAKVYRDAWMNHLDRLYPEYEFARHKGYATRLHLKRLREKGPSPVHRRSFAPVRELAVSESL